MTVKRFMQGFTVTLALCLSATSGRAQEYRVSLLGSYSVVNDATSFSESYIQYKATYADGAKGLVGIEAPYHKYLGFEATFGLGNNNLEINNLTYVPQYTLILAYSIRHYRLSGDLVGHLPLEWRGIRGYGVVGVEYDDLSPTTSAQTLARTRGFAGRVALLQSQGAGGFNFGGGIDHKLTSKVDLRFDVREHLFSSPNFGLLETPTTFSTPYFPVTGTVHNIEFSAGIVYKFGKSK